jgi:methyl-accepting chemotaxis protein
MTDDELRTNLESLHFACHDLFEASQRHDAQIEQLIGASQRHDAQIQQLTEIARDALDSIKRLERIATAHQDRLDDHEERIEGIEDK